MEEELKKFERKNYYASLALESYEDNMGVNIESIENAWELLDKYRKARDTLSTPKKLEFAKEISEKFDLAFEEAGVENFIFYDDNTINYIWKGGKNNE